MSDKPAIIFVDGMTVSRHERAPESVICKLWIRRSELIGWLEKHESDSLNVEIKLSKSGKYYAALDTWKPSQAQRDAPKQALAGEGSRYEDLDDPFPF